MKDLVDKLRRLGGRIKTVVPLALTYGVPGWLLVVLLWKLVTAAIFGDPAMPQMPQNGYVAYENNVHLRWHPRTPGGVSNLEVFRVDGGHRERVIHRQLSGNEVRLPVLEPGGEYCWRVETGFRAREACFETAPAFLHY